MRRALFAAVVLAALLAASAAGAWTWPVDGPVLRPFSLTQNPYAGGQHRGIDIGAPVGARVVAPVAGTVSFAGSIPGGGRALTIRTSDGFAVTLLQLGAVSVVRGAVVEEGAAVGEVGESADAVTAQPHVHLGVRTAGDADGYLDALGFLAAREPAPVPPSSAPDPAPAPAPETPPAEIFVAEIPVAEIAAAPATESPIAPAPAAEPSSPEPAPAVEAPRGESVAAEPPAADPVVARPEGSASEPAPLPALVPAAAPPGDDPVGADPVAVERATAPLAPVAALESAESAEPVAASESAVGLVEPLGIVRAGSPPGLSHSPLAHPAAKPRSAPSSEAGRPAPVRVEVDAPSAEPPRPVAVGPAPAGRLQPTARQTAEPRDASAVVPARPRDGEGRDSPPALFAGTGLAGIGLAVIALVTLALVGLGLEVAVRALRNRAPIIFGDELLPDDTDLLRQLDASHRPRLHDDRGRHPGAPSPAAGREDVLPDGRRRACGQRRAHRGRSGPVAAGVHRPDRPGLARVAQTAQRDQRLLHSHER